MKFIKELKEHDRDISEFLISNVTKGVNSVGGQYFNLELRDCTGTLVAKKWEVEPGDDEMLQIGNVIRIEYEVIKYREALQAKILSARLVNKEDVDVIRFIQHPPRPKEELEKEFFAFVNSIKEETCKKLLDYFIEKNKQYFFVYPAASSIHHEYSSGLLMHTVSMAHLGEFIASHYPNINRDILLTGIILHDMGKLKELEGPILFHYSLEGKLIGHISIMAAEIKEASNKLGLNNEVALLLQHMILSHHGQLEYGSPVLPLTSEALALHMIDNIDSKLTILNKALDETKEGEYTQKIFPLDGRQFYKHK